MIQLNWKTDEKIKYMEYAFGFVIEIGASGDAKLNITDENKLKTKMGDNTSEQAVESYFMTKLKGLLPQAIKNHAKQILEINNKLDEVSDTVKKWLIQAMEDIGVSLEEFAIENIDANAEDIYQKAVAAVNTAQSEEKCLAVATALEAVRSYKDEPELKQKCLENAEKYRKDAIYAEAKKLCYGFNADNYETALKKFETIPGWKDVDAQIELCKTKIAEIKEHDEKQKVEDDRKKEERVQKAKKRARGKVIKIILAIGAVLLVVAVFGIYTGIISPNQSYNEAMSLLENGQVEEAYVLLCEIGKFRGADKLAMEIVQEQLDNCDVGDTIMFGTYTLESSVKGIKTVAVDWLVLDKEDDKVLVLSKYGLESRKFEEGDDDVRAVWGNSSLRRWLNTKFIDKTFTEKEADRIVSVENYAEDSYEFGTDAGENTIDKVFLLSIGEVYRYLDEEDRICTHIIYGEGSSDPYIRSECYWWLRTPGKTTEYASGVDYDGIVREGQPWDINLGYYQVFNAYTVRPAMWIDTTAQEEFFE